MTLTTAIDLGIRRADSSDIAAVAATVTAAFFDDPVTRWLLPDVNRHRRLVHPTFERYVAPYVRAGETYLTDDGNGAAGWLSPGARLFTDHEEVAFVQALEELVGPDMKRFALLAETFERYHPVQPLYYCQFLATAPVMQGRGIGSALLRDMLARADRDGMPAYLEATSPRNRALYERHGFVTQGDVTLPDGPPLWLMWRDPR